MTPVRLKPAAPRSRVQHSTTEPLRSPPPKKHEQLPSMQKAGIVLAPNISHPKLTRNPDFSKNTKKTFFSIVIWASTQKRRPAWASVQSDQRLCNSPKLESIMSKLSTGVIQFSNGDRFEPRFVGNPQDRFCRVEAHFV